MKHQFKSLLERIKHAETPEEIASLLAKGDTEYSWASGSTQRRWHRAAKQRLEAMEDGE